MHFFLLYILISSYSDELLLEEDNSDVSTLALEINNILSIGNANDVIVNNKAGKSVLGQHQAPFSSNFLPPYQRCILFLYPSSLLLDSEHLIDRPVWIHINYELHLSFILLCVCLFVLKKKEF